MRQVAHFRELFSTWCAVRRMAYETNAPEKDEPTTGHRENARFDEALILPVAKGAPGVLGSTGGGSSGVRGNEIGAALLR